MKSLLLAATAATTITLAAHAAPVSVIQLGQTAAGNTVVGMDNGGLTGATGATTLSINNAVVDVTQLLDNSPFPGVFEFMSAHSIDNAQTVAGSFVLQHFAGGFCVSTAASCGGTILLQGTFTDAAFGNQGGSQLTINVANPPDTLTLFSDVIPAPQLVAPSSLTFGFTSLTPGLTIGANQSINGFGASFVSNVSASRSIPEPVSLTILGTGLLGLIAIRRRA